MENDAPPKSAELFPFPTIFVINLFAFPRTILFENFLSVSSNLELSDAKSVSLVELSLKLVVQRNRDKESKKKSIRLHP